MTCKDTFLLSRNSFSFSNVKIVAACLIVSSIKYTFMYTWTCKLRWEECLFDYYQQSVYDLKIVVHCSLSEVIQWLQRHCLHCLDGHTKA